MLVTAFPRVALPNTPGINVHADDNGVGYALPKAEHFIARCTPKGKDFGFIDILQVQLALLEQLWVAIGFSES